MIFMRYTRSRKMGSRNYEGCNCHIVRVQNIHEHPQETAIHDDVVDLGCRPLNRAPFSYSNYVLNIVRTRTYSIRLSRIDD